MKLSIIVTIMGLSALFATPQVLMAQPVPSNGCPGTVFNNADLPFSDTNITNGMASFYSPHQPAHTCAVGTINAAVGDSDDVAYQFTPLTGNAGGCQVTFNGGDGHVIVTDDPNCGNLMPGDWVNCVFQGTGPSISFNFNVGTDGTAYQIFIDQGDATSVDISCWPTVPVELSRFTVE